MCKWLWLHAAVIVSEEDAASSYNFLRLVEDEVRHLAV